MTWIDEEEPRRAVVTGDGVSLSTAVTGAGRPHVLWLHGGPGMFDYLAPAAQAVTFGTHVRFDQRGCGRSDRVGPFTLERYLLDIEDVCCSYALDRPVVAGHSFGATLALLHALAHPSTVAAVLYVSGTGTGRAWREAHHAEHDRRLTVGQRHRRDELRSRSAQWSWEEEVEYRRLSYLPDVADPDRAAALVEPLAAAPWRINLECNNALGAEGRRDLDGEQLTRRCAALDVPVLVVHGAEDPHPLWATDSLVGALPDVRRIVLDGSGHLPFVERPADFATAVEPFLGSLNDRAPDRPSPARVTGTTRQRSPMTRPAR